MDIIKKQMELPAPTPGAPGMFRCAENSLMTELFALAGLKNINQVELTSYLNCGNTDTYWDFMSEVAGPVVMALSQTNDETREKIKRELYELVEQKYGNDAVQIESKAYIVSGVK